MAISFRTFMKYRAEMPVLRAPSPYSEDFIRDALADADFPSKRSFGAMISHLRIRGSCAEAREGLIDTWRDWMLFHHVHDLTSLSLAELRDY